MPLLVTANSPGEIAGWLRPVLASYTALHPQESVVVILLPCTWATGQEERVAAELPGVERVIPVAGLPRLLWRPETRYRGCAHLHLGGDLMYAALLNWRLGLRSWSYLWARRWWDWAFEGYFTKDRRGRDWLLRRRIAEEKIFEVGDLLVDAVYERARPTTTQSGQISFLPGSRLEEVKTLTPLFLGVAERLMAQRPDCSFDLHLSPFIAVGVEALTAPPDPKVGGVPGRLEGEELVSPAGVRVRVHRGGSLPDLARSQLAVSIPGTKTGEAACLGVPSLTIIPLNRPEKLPALGLLSLLDFLPGGDRIKGRLLLRGKAKLGLVAQPNIKAGRSLMPELVEVMNPKMLAQAVLEQIENGSHLRKVRAELLELYQPDRGASRRLAEKL